MGSLNMVQWFIDYGSWVHYIWFTGSLIMVHGFIGSYGFMGSLVHMGSLFNGFMV